MTRRGFTLIELVAVIALIGLIVGATAWSMTGRVRGSTRANVVSRLAFADRMARLAAQRLGRPGSLRFDLAEQRVSRSMDGDGRSELHSLPLPRGVRIERVMVAGREVSADTRDAVVTIPMSSGGRSATYAVRILFADADPQAADGLGPRGGWIVFAGLTGQVTLVSDDSDVENLFAPPPTTRPDAR